jgi:hypothetical protein
MAMSKEKAIHERVKKIRKLMKENQSAGVEKINSLFRDNILINQNEYDLRETLKEIIEKYPHVKAHKKLLDK